MKFSAALSLSHQKTPNWRSSMKITSILVLRCSDSSSDPTVVASATDVSRFGFFQRNAAKEFILFAARTVAKRTQPGQRQSVQHEEYKVHVYNRNGLCALGFMDDHYPVRSAFSLLNMELTNTAGEDVAFAMNAFIKRLLAVSDPKEMTKEATETSAPELAKLLYWLMMVGYSIRNIEVRFDMERLLGSHAN